jgi:hypothetical protein
MAGIGASCPFRLVLANVPSPNPRQPFAAAGDNLLGQAVSRGPNQRSLACLLVRQKTKEAEYKLTKYRLSRCVCDASFSMLKSAT